MLCCSVVRIYSHSYLRVSVTESFHVQNAIYLAIAENLLLQIARAQPLSHDHFVGKALSFTIIYTSIIRYCQLISVLHSFVEVIEQRINSYFHAVILSSKTYCAGYLNVFSRQHCLIQQFITWMIYWSSTRQSYHSAINVCLSLLC